MENALPTLLVRNDNAIMLSKKHSSVAVGKAADRKKPLIADADIGPVMSRRESSAKKYSEESWSKAVPLESREEKKYNEKHWCEPSYPIADLCLNMGKKGKRSKPLQVQSIPQDPMQRNEFLASLNRTSMQQQKNGKANQDASQGSVQNNANTSTGRPCMESVTSQTQQRRRSTGSIGSLGVKQSPVFSMKKMNSHLSSSIENTIAQTLKADHKSPSSFKLAEQKFQDERDEWLSDGKLKQVHHQMKTRTGANQPFLNSYAKFKQRREITKELNCPVDIAKDAQGLFDRYAKNGVLDYKNFKAIAVHILNFVGKISRTRTKTRSFGPGVK